MITIPHPSPNFGPRRAPYDKSGPRLIVLHYTDMVPVEAALARLCDPAAEVSAHYLISRAGDIYQLVEDDKRAWHAGVSAWQGESDVNSASLGIELDNPGHSNGYVPFADAQLAALTDLCRSLMQKHGIAAENIIGHSDVAPGRKQDPGALFPWEGFRAGLQSS